MNKKFRPTVFLSLVVLLSAGLVLPARAGDLEPPGPPSPTMKTLEQVEPRIPVQSLPRIGTVYVISQPGSYYLIDNIQLINGVAISIEASDVVLDLNGFSLIGGPSTDTAINIMGGRVNVTIRNGIIRDWPVNGIFGINCAGCAFEDLLVENTGTRASTPSIWMGWQGVVRRVTVRGNPSAPGVQIEFNGWIEESIASENYIGFNLLGDTGAIFDSIATNNAAEGIHLEASSSAFRCQSGFNNQGIVVVAGGRVVGCTLAGNGNAVAVYGNGAQIEDNLINHQWGDSIYLDPSAQRARVASNLIRCDSPNTGIQTNGSSGHLIIGNLFHNCDFDIDGGGANAVGEVLDYTGGGPVESNNPFANIRF